MLDLLFRILEIPSISGYEESFISLWADIIRSQCERTWTDPFGNCIGVINEDAPRSILINAHCDEIGLITTKIDDKNTVRFKGIGMNNPSLLYGQRVIILNGENTPGLIQSSKKLEKDDDKLKMEDLFIDIGAETREEAEKLVKIGSYIWLESAPKKLQENKIMGKGLDDKAGLAVMYYLMKNIRKDLVSNIKIYFAATLKEEINSGGAVTICNTLKPDYSLSIDVSETNDLAESKSNDCSTGLGKGPILLHCPLLDRKLSGFIIKAAENKGIKLQFEAEPHFSYTDADVIHKVRSGIPSSVISIPIRYIHTPNEMIHLGDLENTAELTLEFLNELSKFNRCIH